MKVSIFIKSWQRDFVFLEYAKRSIAKYASGFHEIVLMLPEGEFFDWPQARVIHVREQHPTYIFQQICKCYEDVVCKSDYVLNFDSDCVFTRPVEPLEFFQDDKPIWIIKPFDQVRPDQQVWRPCMEKFLGEPVTHEGMYRHPMIFTRELLQRLRAFCQFKHNATLDEYALAQADPGNPLALTFSEFNIASAFARRHMPDAYRWVDTSKEKPRPDCVYQCWSHGGLTDAIRAKLEQILKGGDAQWPPSVLSVGNSTGTENVVVRNGAETVQPASAPMPVSFAIATLAAEAQKGNINKARVVAQLVKAGIVPSRPMKKRKAKA